MNAAKPLSLVENFGANVSFQPQDHFEPRSETELLDILRSFPNRRFRAVGSLHSWSQAALAEDILINVRHLNSVKVIDNPAPYAEIGAGCLIKNVVEQLLKQGNYTLPSLGLIKEQSIAGATATGTHGSGRNCLSHFIIAVRLATFDPSTQQPIIRVIEGGEWLNAAKCSLGCLGIITNIRMAIRRQYQIEEHFCRYSTLQDVIEAESTFPLQQFYFIPWRWDFYAQHRREVDSSRSVLAPLYRAYWGIGMDVIFHLVVRFLTRSLPPSCSKFYYRWILPLLVPQMWKVVDRSDRQLTMRHELFRHIETEIFVTGSRLDEAIQFVTWLIRHSAGDKVRIETAWQDRLEASSGLSCVESLQGQYTHQYPICIRKVLPDETLISMSSGGNEPYYAISFISYALPDQRTGFFHFAEVLSKATAVLFQARPHWGKYCPLSPPELQSLYPTLREFARIRQELGSSESFTNEWMKTILDVAL